MKAISVGLIFVLCYTSALAVAEGNSCVVEGELTPHNDCTKYYQCDNGVQVVQNCPLGTYFSPKNKYCDHPSQVPECVGGTRPPIGTTQAPVTTEEPAVTTEEAVATTEEPAVTTEEPAVTTEEPAVTTEEPAVTTEEPAVTTEEPAVTTEEPAVTTEEPAVTTEEPAVTTEEPAVTTEEPAVTTEEPAMTTEEPAVTTEDPVQTTQSPPETSTVEAGACLNDGVYKIPYPGNCSLYILCVNYTPFTQVCPEHTFYDPAEQQCNIADLVPGCNPEPLCADDEVIYKPIPGNCTAYIICAYGKVFPECCPAGMEFDPNPEVLQCNLAEDVDCDDGSNTESAIFIYPQQNSYKHKRPQRYLPHSHKQYFDNNFS